MSDPAGNAVSLAGMSSGVGAAVGAASGGLVTVTVRGINVAMLAARDVTFAAGDPVAFVRAGQTWVAVARTATAPPAALALDNPPPPTTRPTSVTGSKTFTPVETRSRRGADWRTDTDDVYQGEYGGTGNHTGCAFYGTGPASLAGATVTSASVLIRRRAAGGITAAQATTLRLVTETVRPSGGPSLGSTTAGPSLAWGESSSFTIPSSWAQAMVDGTAGGLALFESDGDPYVIMDGRGRFAAAFALTIRYSRTI